VLSFNAGEDVSGLVCLLVSVPSFGRFVFQTVRHLDGEAMGVVKTTIVVDEETWNAFRKFVSSRYGSSRMLSFAVEEALKSSNVVDMLVRFCEAIRLKADEYPSVRDVERRRPKLDTSAGTGIRGMRDERQTRILGLK
jgi:hypothetical protein